MTTNDNFIIPKPPTWTYPKSQTLTFQSRQLLLLQILSQEVNYFLSFKLLNVETMPKVKKMSLLQHFQPNPLEYNVFLFKIL